MLDPGRWTLVHGLVHLGPRLGAWTSGVRVRLREPLRIGHSHWTLIAIFSAHHASAHSTQQASRTRSTHHRLIVYIDRSSSHAIFTALTRAHIIKKSHKTH